MTLTPAAKALTANLVSSQTDKQALFMSASNDAAWRQQL